MVVISLLGIHSATVSSFEALSSDPLTLTTTYNILHHYMEFNFITTYLFYLKQGYFWYQTGGPNTQKHTKPSELFPDPSRRVVV